MIECSNCETPQFLQIVYSRIVVDEDDGQPSELEERYECTACNGQGEYRYDPDDGERKYGSIKLTSDMPVISI